MPSQPANQVNSLSMYRPYIKHAPMYKNVDVMEHTGYSYVRCTIVSMQ